MSLRQSDVAGASLLSSSDASERSGGGGGSGGGSGSTSESRRIGEGVMSMVDQSLNMSGLSLVEDGTTFDVASSDIEMGECIGRGAFGEVFRGKLRGKSVAVKRLFGEVTMEHIETMRKEVAVMSKLRHPNILMFMGACFETTNLLIVTELCSANVHSKLREADGKALSLTARVQIAKETAMGMNWLHTHKPVFVHRDLKTSNLLLDAHMTVKVSDFGLSHVKANVQQQGAYGAVGTPLWMAPEVLMNREYDERCDLYSYGMLVWELFSGADPFPDVRSFATMVETVVDRRTRPRIVDTTPRTLSTLITQCWDAEPARRVPFQHMLDEQLFDQATCEVCISDRLGCLFWQREFMSRGQGLRLSVPWKQFTAHFCSYLNVQVPRTLDDLRFNCLRAVLLDDAAANDVPIEKWGALLQWFGPVVSGEDLLDRIQEQLRKPWFHGYIQPPAAEQKLVKEKKGCFLVRFSTRDPGSYAITCLADGKKLKHYRIPHKPDQPYMIGKTECASIDEIISKYGKDLGINAKHPCPDSPFAHLFVSASKKSKDKAPVSVGYQTPDFDD